MDTYDKLYDAHERLIDYVVRTDKFGSDLLSGEMDQDRLRSFGMAGAVDDSGDLIFYTRIEKD